MHFWMRLVALVATLASALFLAACGADIGTPGTGACTPGTSRTCVCFSGDLGSQFCSAAGIYGACTGCPSTSPPPDTACSPSRPAGACPTGQTCVSGACCATSQACGAVCCNENSACVQDAAGNRACATRCTRTSECPGAPGARCCRVLVDATTRAPLPFGACGTFVSGETSCRCAVGADCGSGACTPSLGSDGVPRAPLICTTPQCAPYSQCGGVLPSCGDGYCNMCDAAGNCYCAQICTSDAQCGGATGARCTTLARAIGSCANTQTVCVPR